MNLSNTFEDSCVSKALAISITPFLLLIKTIFNPLNVLFLLKSIGTSASLTVILAILPPS